MRLGIATLAILCFIAPLGGNAQPEGIEVSFLAPAEFSGIAQSKVDWLALVLSPENTLRAHGTVNDEAILENYTVIRTHVQDPLTGSSYFDENELPPQRSQIARSQFNITAANGWTAIILQGDIDLNALGDGRIAWGQHGDPWSKIEGPREYPSSVARPSARSLSVAGGHIATAGALEFSAAFNSFEWHGLVMDCAPNGGPCKENLGNTGLATNGLLPAEASEYQRLIGSGTLQWSGTVHSLIAGSGDLALSLNGTLRLPLARGTSDCEGCTFWNDESLAMTGNILLDNLAANGDRIEATLSGEAFHLFLDETAKNPELFGFSPSTVGAVAGIAGFGFLALFALRAALSPDRALENLNRRRIRDVVAQKPGINFRDLLRVAEIGNGNAIYHLGILEAARVLRSRRQANQIHYYLLDDYSNGNWKSQLALAKPELARLDGLLEGMSTPTQKEIIAITSEWGWSRAVTQKRLRKLEEAGRLQVIKLGRFLHYSSTARGETLRPIPGVDSVSSPSHA